MTVGNIFVELSEPGTKFSRQHGGGKSCSVLKEPVNSFTFYDLFAIAEDMKKYVAERRSKGFVSDLEVIK